MQEHVLAGDDPGLPPTHPTHVIATSPAPVSTGARPPALVPAQLPAAPTSFAGRGAALAAISAACGPVTVISGMAGVGKTTLALHWAHTHAGDFPDGQLYVNLRGFDASSRITNPADALHDLLRTLGVAPTALPGDIEASGALLRTVLANRRVLIVLDNARDARQVEPLLPGRTDSAVIVTSRNRLTPLVARTGADLVHLEPFTGEEAAEFLAGRLGPDRVGDASEAVRRLHDTSGGLPLALAIVAARGVLNPMFSLELLATEMSNSVAPLDLLVDDDQEVDLREVLTWSYRALAPDAAAALRALAVHPGPEISQAAAVSLTAMPPARTRTALAALTAANLLREVAPGRFTVHDLVRRYALEQASAEIPRITRRLVEHYMHSTRAAWLQHGRPPLVPLPTPTPGIEPESPSGVVGAHEWYKRERVVLQGVVRRAAESGDHQAVLCITLDWRPMTDNVDARELLPYVRLALQAAAALEADHDGDIPLVLIAECHRDAATEAARRGDVEAARRHYDAALHRFEQLGDLAGQSSTLRNMTFILLTDPDERAAMSARAVDLARRCDNPMVLISALGTHGAALVGQAKFQDAILVLQEALPLAAQYPGGESAAPYLLVPLAKCHYALDDLDEGIALGERALEGARRFDHLIVELDLLPPHGDALLAAGHPARAAQAWQRYLALSTNSGIAQWVAHVSEDGCSAEDTARDVHAKLAALPDATEPAPGAMATDTQPAQHANVLTKRELQVATLIAEGATNKAIASELQISRRTAEAHVENILNKLGFSSRTQIALWVSDQR
jgi:DNA-binding CsgD family transcriptional regulator